MWTMLYSYKKFEQILIKNKDNIDRESNEVNKRFGIFQGAPRFTYV